MFLHLGSEVIVSMCDVIYIGDIKLAETAKSTREFLDIAKEEGFLEDVSSGTTKSFIVTSSKVFLSSISTGTLVKRAKSFLTSI